MPSPPRFFSACYVSAPEDPGVRTIVYGDPATPAFLWLLLRQLFEVPDRGRALFPKPLAQQNLLWRAISNYMRQAKAYWEAASRTEGSSATLLYYYAFLNLAKSELLTTVPAAISGKRINHGLSYSPTNAMSMRGDVLKVVDGVFPLLYEKRTGKSLLKGTLLRVPRLFSMVREIGLEVDESGISDSQTQAVYHAVASDKVAAWPLLCFLADGFVGDAREPVTRILRRHFEQIDIAGMPVDWRQVFAISRRLNPGSLLLFQSKQTYSTGSNTNRLVAAHMEAASLVRSVLRPYITDPVTAPVEFLLSPSLKKTMEFPMPASLARYALMYYASSLVRYKPSALDPIREAPQAWLMDSFAREAPIHLLGSALSGIRGAPLAFESVGYRT